MSRAFAHLAVRHLVTNAPLAAALRSGSPPDATPAAPSPSAPPGAKVERRRGANDSVQGRYATEWRLTIPGAPVGKGRPRTTKQGHVYTPEATRGAENAIKLLAQASGQQMLGEGRIAMRVAFWCATWRGDLDNLVKLVSDALNGIAYADDRLIDRIEAERFIDKAAPCTKVHLTLTTGGAAAVAAQTRLPLAAGGAQ